MDSIIIKGLKGEQEEIVSEMTTALYYGSGNVEVYATPAMIALMETTAMKSLAEFLPDGLTSVGTEVNIKHLRASAIGHRLRCESRVIDVQGRKIVFEVSVWDEELLVGHGTHTRVVVDSQKFMSQF